MLLKSINTDTKRQRLFTLPFALLFLVISSLANAKDSEFLSNFNDQWMNLNHYNIDGISDINNDEYFVSDNGRTNPDAELDAFISTVKSYQKNKDEKSKEILCKFPARLTLLISNVTWLSESDRPTCAVYNEKNKPKKIKSISLVFASGYFGNPSSYYGHTLLKYNYDNSVLNQKALDGSLNYGADVTDHEGSFFYILKGLLGGYNATYQRNNDFIHSYRYTNGQLRDLWEYELELTPEQVRLVVEHSWELMNAEFKYYFVNDNCAHRIINVVERATNTNLSESHGFWLLPIQAVHQARDSSNGKHKLIKSEKYVPSLRSKFMQSYNKLSESEKEMFISFFGANMEKKVTLSEKMPKNILYLILDQLNLEVSKLKNIEKDTKKHRVLESKRRIVLNELYKTQNIAKPNGFIYSKSQTLLNDKPSSLLRVGSKFRNEKDAATIRYQIANNDLLDTPMPGQENSRFVMGAIETDFLKSDIDLRELTVVDIANLNTNPLPMRITNEFSWGIKIGYGNQNRVCDNCGAFSFTGKLGKAIRLNDKLMVYSLSGVKLNHKEVNNQRYASIVSENFVITNVSEKINALIGIDLTIDPILGNPAYIMRTDFSYDLDKTKDIRLGYETNMHESALMLNMGFYFN